MTKIVHFETSNLMIPAFGATRCLPAVFPNTNGSTIDFNAVNIEDVPFRPQSVCIDASNVPTTESVTFTITQINFTKIIQGGNTVTFNFPAITNMIISVTPSDGISPVQAFFYNYPSFVDFQGIQQVELTGSGGGVQDVNIVSPDPLPVTFGGTQDVNILTPNPLPVIVDTNGTFSQSVLTVLSASVLTVPANAARKYLMIQNNDAAGIIYIALDGDPAVTAANGFKVIAGGSIELAQFVPTGDITLIGSIASNANVILAEGV
jgi:hypothetical protein